MNRRSELLYGTVCGLFMSGWTLAEFALGFHTTSIEAGRYTGFVSFLFPVVFIGTALHDRQKAAGSPLPWLEGITTGFRIAFFAALFFTVFMTFYTLIINPGWLDATADWQRREFIRSGATDDEIGRFMEQQRQVNGPMARFIMGFIGATGLGVLVTLIEIPLLRLMARR